MTRALLDTHAWLWAITAPDRLRDDARELIADAGNESLAIEHRHALRVGALPLHHHDPFDRLLIAQAQVEGLPIITADGAFERYDVRVIRAA